MTSCIREEDTMVDALTIPGAQTAPPSSPVSNTTATSSAVDLSKITNRLLTIDLNSTTALKTVGGYISRSGIVVAQVSAGVYIAVTQTCSHEPRKNIIFNKTEFYCTVHGARFDLIGKGKNSFGSRGLSVYKTATDGLTLVVYS
ncbi:Rieske 2Fe-2S domain-containing protein [Larkinella rosea]|nr:Rieske 2Fe-2S domain-containing protein [Larkinella rosea]